MKQVTCKICGFVGYNLVSHLNRKHKISGSEYLTKFPTAKILDLDQIDKDKISKAVTLAMKDDTLRKYLSDVQRSGASRYTIKYWTNKGYSEQEAELKVKEIQSKNSSKSKKFKGKTHSEETKLRIKQKMKAHINSIESGSWANHFGDLSTGTSKLECEIFSYIKTNINANVIQWKHIENYIVDIAIDNKVIEVYGDFWHANPKIYASNYIFPKIIGENITSKVIWEKNAIRIEKIVSAGYSVLIIWERDWNKHRDETIKNINKFLSNDIKTKNQ